MDRLWDITTELDSMTNQATQPILAQSDRDRVELESLVEQHQHVIASYVARLG